eukprot:53806-Pelagomonas_calceolata.AAC.1
MGASMQVIMLCSGAAPEPLPLLDLSSGKPMTLRSQEKSVREPAALHMQAIGVQQRLNSAGIQTSSVLFCLMAGCLVTG